MSIPFFIRIDKGVYCIYTKVMKTSNNKTTEVQVKISPQQKQAFQQIVLHGGYGLSQVLRNYIAEVIRTGDPFFYRKK